MYESGGYPLDRELTVEYMKIAQWLKKLRFRKKIFGGICERDVWNKISELNAMYEEALTAERIRYDALIDHYKNSSTITTHEDIAADGK